MKIFIASIFWSLSCFALLVEDMNPEFLYVYINYQNKKIDNYFLVVGLEKNKIKFSEVSSSSIYGFQEYLKIKKIESGTIFLKTSEICLQDLSENKGLHSFDSEYGSCRRSSVVENLGNTSFVFWYKKLYYSFRDFVDWL